MIRSLLRVRFPVRRSFASASNMTLIVPSKNFIKEQTEYKQIPDDSKFVDAYFKDLKEFKAFLETNGKYKNFTDYEKEPNLLINELEKWVQFEIFPQISEQESSLGQRIVIAKYKDLIRSFKITMLLNGGHTFIFDLLMRSKEALDKFDDNSV